MHERVSRPPLSRRVEVPQTKHQTQFALRTTSSARIGDVIGAAAEISISVPCHSLRRSTVPCMPTIGRFGSKGPRRGGGAARSRLWEGNLALCRPPRLVGRDDAGLTLSKVGSPSAAPPSNRKLGNRQARRPNALLTCCSGRPNTSGQFCAGNRTWNWTHDSPEDRKEAEESSHQ